MIIKIVRILAREGFSESLNKDKVTDDSSKEEHMGVSCVLDTHNRIFESPHAG
jgi:hypothetical protein